MKRNAFQLAALAVVCIAVGGATGYWYANTQAITQRDEIAKDAASAAW